MTIRIGTEVDAQVAARLHAQEISEGFLSSLGVPFLTRLYRRIARCPHSFLFVAESENSVAGFAAATEDVSRLYRTFLFRDGLPAFAVAAPALARSGRQALETLRHGHESRALPVAEVVAVAVATSFQGRGLGRELVQAATGELRRRGVASAKVVAGADNVAAVGLYKACGFQTVEHREIHSGTRSVVLVWS